MFCRNCGVQLSAQAAFCTGCGVGTGTGNRFCYNCGAQADPAAAVCVKCGVALYAAPGAAPAGYPGAVPGGYPGVPPSPLKSKLVAGLLGIFLGGLGIHRFYLGYNTIGVIQILVTVVGGIITCGIGWLAGSIWGLVEGILILTGSINKDAQGRPLAE
jgi:TM2 domain-containing membrane protein YozV/ribosomal protein L40E